MRMEIRLAPSAPERQQRQEPRGQPSAARGTTVAGSRPASDETPARFNSQPSYRHRNLYMGKIGWMSPASTLTRTRLSRELRMEQTLAAAHTLFAARGYGTVTMDEVAAAVGVTKPLLYNYFGNKERLYLACMEPAGDALLAA